MEIRELEQRLATLEDRVRLLEDQVEIQQQISSWGPAVDTGNPAAAAGLFAEDGFVQNEIFRMEAQSEIMDMVNGERLQARIRQGCAHVNSFPLVKLSGDRATALSYSRQYLKTADGWRIARCSANHWRLVRGDTGWKIISRENHIIDGGPEARAILIKASDGR
jgi:hypothetical protein